MVDNECFDIHDNDNDTDHDTDGDTGDDTDDNSNADTDDDTDDGGRGNRRMGLGGTVYTPQKPLEGSADRMKRGGHGNRFVRTVLLWAVICGRASGQLASPDVVHVQVDK